jgi:hypothetical protein
VALCATYFIGTAGQREGWIRAAEYNEKVVSEIDSAMMKAQIESADSLTIIAEIRGLPGSVNGEPVFATWWDLGPALELRHPAMRVRANVYEAKRTVGDANGITVDGYWRAVFPFYYFGEGRGELRLVSSRAQWLELIER